MFLLSCQIKLCWPEIKVPCIVLGLIVLMTEYSLDVFIQMHVYMTWQKLKIVSTLVIYYYKISIYIFERVKLAQFVTEIAEVQQQHWFSQSV